MLWTDKYRPKNMDDLVIDENTRNKIKKIIEEKDMPNIIITGVPGVGKTTTALCIARALYGKHVKSAVLELNASDDRGIKAITDNIYFCKKKLALNKEGEEKKYASHKIILLDEADNMTIKAQRLVNILMEKYHETTRFIFTCNNSSDIIESIQSKCIIFRYTRLSNEQVVIKLKDICENEKVEYTTEALNVLASVSQGDLRSTTNCLQLVHNTYGTITADNVGELCHMPHPTFIKKMFISCHKKDIKNALKIFYELRGKGFSVSDIVLSMINTLKTNDFVEIDEETKIDYLDKISKTAYIVSKGIDTNLQMTGCLTNL